MFTSPFSDLRAGPWRGSGHTEPLVCPPKTPCKPDPRTHTHTPPTAASGWEAGDVRGKARSRADFQTVGAEMLENLKYESGAAETTTPRRRCWLRHSRRHRQFGQGAGRRCRSCRHPVPGRVEPKEIALGLSGETPFPGRGELPTPRQPRHAGERDVQPEGWGNRSPDMGRTNGSGSSSGPFPGTQWGTRRDLRGPGTQKPRERRESGSLPVPRSP